MTRNEIIEIINEQGLEDVVLFESPSYDSAFIGISHDDRAVYSYDKMVEYLVEQEEMTEEEAADFIGYNTLRAMPYMPNSPIVVFDYEKYR